MTELQERLQHLVNYSSQLIFVSGDTIAQQQRSLEDFVSVQKENTEIAYFTAEPDLESTDYRRKICQQLMGQRVGSYIRPLAVLLEELQNEPGPFLVCIKQSQFLPNDFLQELWNWVIQSRKQSDKQHLNVILFGETTWAEQAKQWLPNKNSSKPVLLSSQSIDPNPFDSNALATLMADKRTFFSSRLFTSASGRKTLITNRNFILSILVVFLLCFTGIISWQYPEHVKSLITTGTLPSASEQSTVASADDNAASDDQSDNTVLRTTTPNDEMLSQSTLEVVEDDSFSAQDILVSIWNNAQSDESENADPEDSDARATDLEEDSFAASDSQENTSITSDELDIATASASQTEDFAVPDILNVEQLDAVLGNRLLEDGIDSENDTASIGNPNNVAQQTLNSADNTVSNSQSPSYSFDENALLLLPDNAILLQLSGIQNPQVLQTYISSNNLSNNTWIYQTERYGGPWYVVLYKQTFSDLPSARQVAQTLAQNLQASEPFAKVASQVKQEIQNQ